MAENSSDVSDTLQTCEEAGPDNTLENIEIKEELDDTYEDITLSANPQGTDDFLDLLEPEVQLINVETQAPSVDRNSESEKWNFMEENFSLVSISSAKQKATKKNPSMSPVVTLKKIDADRLKLFSSGSCIVKADRIYPVGRDFKYSDGVEIQKPLHQWIKGNERISKLQASKVWKSISKVTASDLSPMRSPGKSASKRRAELMISKLQEPETKKHKIFMDDDDSSATSSAPSPPSHQFDDTDDKYGFFMSDEANCPKCEQYKKELQFVNELLKKKDNEYLKILASKEEEIRNAANAARFDGCPDDDKLVYSAKDMRDKESIYIKIIQERNKKFLESLKEKDIWMQNELATFKMGVREKLQEFQQFKQKEDQLKKKLVEYKSFWEKCIVQRDKYKKALEDQSEIFCKEGAETMRDFTKVQQDYDKLKSSSEDLKTKVREILKQQNMMISQQELLCDRIVMETKKREVLELKKADLENLYRVSKKNEENVLAQRRFIEKFLDEKSREFDFKLKNIISQYKRQLNTYRRIKFKLSSQVADLKKKCKDKKFLSEFSVTDPSVIVRAAAQYLSEHQLAFLENQLYLNSKFDKNRIYLKELKEMSVRLFETSPYAYSIIKQLFFMPSEQKVKQWMNETPVEEGLDPASAAAAAAVQEHKQEALRKIEQSASGDDDFDNIDEGLIKDKPYQRQESIDEISDYEGASDDEKDCVGPRLEDYFSSDDEIVESVNDFEQPKMDV